MTTFTANRKFPNPVTVTDDPKSHTLALQQVIEALNIGQRRTKEVSSSYVRVHELVDVGLIEVVGNQLKLTNLGASVVAGGATELADLTDVDLTGLTNGDVLTWNSGTSKWEPGIAGGAFDPTDMYAASLNDLSDVSFYMPSDGDILRYNAALGIWQADFVPCIPKSTKSSGTLENSDRGTCVLAAGGVTFPADVFSAGDSVSVFNGTASAITLTQGANLTLRLAGTTATGNRTLAAYGLATVWYGGTRLAVISGAGLT